MSGLGYTLRYFAADLAPMIVFLLVFLASKNIYLATGVGIGLSVLQIGWSFARKSPIGMLQWAGFGLIAVFGAATLVAGGLFLIQNVFLRTRVSGRRRFPGGAAARADPAARMRGAR